MCECQKGKLSTDLNYFLQSDTLTISFQNKRKTKMTLFDFESKIAFDIWNTNNFKIKYKWQKYNQLSRRGILYDTLFLIQNDDYDTCIKDDSSIRLLLTKEDCKWLTNTQKHLQFLTDGGWNMWRKKVSKRRYWSCTTKLLNKFENKETKPNFQRRNQYHSIITPTTQGNRDASHLQHREVWCT